MHQTVPPRHFHLHHISGEHVTFSSLGRLLREAQKLRITHHIGASHYIAEAYFDGCTLRLRKSLMYRFVLKNSIGQPIGALPRYFSFLGRYDMLPKTAMLPGFKRLTGKSEYDSIIHYLGLPKIKVRPTHIKGGPVPGTGRIRASALRRIPRRGQFLRQSHPIYEEGIDVTARTDKERLSNLLAHDEFHERYSYRSWKNHRRTQWRNDVPSFRISNKYPIWD